MDAESASHPSDLLKSESCEWKIGKCRQVRKFLNYFSILARRRKSSLEDLTLQKDGDEGNLKKSCEYFQSSLSVVDWTNIFLASSAIKTSELLDCDLNAECDALDKEIENLCPFGPRGDALLKVADSRYCDIFSRQSIESNENSSPDDEERVNFSIELMQHSTSDVVQLIPKKPQISTKQSTEIYQPCTNTIIQLKPSSFSAFREISEVKQFVQLPDEDNKSPPDTDQDDGAAAAAVSSEDPQWIYKSLKCMS